MWINSAGFTAGVLICQQLPVLPQLYWLPVLLLPVFFRSRNVFISGLFFLMFGFGWSVLLGSLALQDRLLPELVKQEILVTGEVVNLPVRRNNGWQFDFVPKTALRDGKTVSLPGKIRLGWYRTDADVFSGQTWQLSVRLKPPVATFNPGLFDYETWLFQQGIGARGYVLKRENNRLLQAGSWYNGFGYFREKLRAGMNSFNAYSEAAALVTALSVGDKTGISATTREMFRRSGINHLVAISGLHIGMMALLAYTLSGYAWRCSSTLCNFIPAPSVQSLSAVLAAGIYAGLAGFSIPTQRALIMLLVVMLSRLLLVNPGQARQLAIAVFFVLLADPVSITSPGFWLSFIAVVAIYQAMRQTSGSSGVTQLFAMQWSITLFLLPFSLFWFDRVSVISPAVNLILVPVFSFFVVPVSLLLTLLNVVDRPEIDLLTRFFLQLLELGMGILEQLVQIPWVTYDIRELDKLSFLLLLGAAIGWHQLRSKRSRLFAVLIILAVLVSLKKDHHDETFRLFLLDVGQGLSIFIEQGNKTLLYDLGPRYGGTGSATESIVVPFLLSRGVGHIDKLIISHLDSDHAGDLDALKKKLPVKAVYSAEKIQGAASQRNCVSGESWQWGATKFSVLSPDAGSSYNGNNVSCVIKIHLGKTAILLTGDIEKAVEKRLLKTRPGDLASSIVVIPHHGSRSSSTTEFVKAVNPDIVLNSSAYLNRYHFPANEIRQRWLQQGEIFLDTAIQGAVKIEIDNTGKLLGVTAFREKNRKYWHWLR